MSLPGLNAAAAEPAVAVASINVVDLKAQTEWRFEVAHGSSIEVKLISGNAELFGTELAIKQVYLFSGTKAAIFTWQGCQIEITGDCQVEYVAEDTPVASYANLHLALEKMRDEARTVGNQIALPTEQKSEPRILIAGPEDSGKTSLVKFLTAYGIRAGRQPMTVSLDTGEGFLSAPGTISACTFTSILDVEEGWGASPINGPTSIPVKLPLVYYLGKESPTEASDVYEAIVSRLALSVLSRLKEDSEARQSGCIIDTPGVISNGKANYGLLHHIVAEFSVNTIVTLGSERLYSDLVRRFQSQKIGDGGPITILKLDKSGGCVSRDSTYRQQQCQAQVREYFFGTRKTPLSPHIQQVDFAHLSILKTRQQDSTEEFNASLLPGDYDGTEVKDDRLFDRVEAPSPLMQNAVLAIVDADASEREENIRNASVIGFIVVAEVDEKRNKLRILAPISGRIPRKAIIWGSWPVGMGEIAA